MSTRARTTNRILLGLALPLALAACGGSAGSAGTTSTSAPTGATGITGATAPPPQIPFALGTRAALGDWELAVDAATPEATTTISARLANVSGKAVPAPPSTVFTLQDGPTKLPVVAQVAGLPTTMAPNVDARITITFVGPSAPVDPYLHWNGTTKDALQASVKLTPGDPIAPLG
jgi:hypothetical protein